MQKINEMFGVRKGLLLLACALFSIVLLEECKSTDKGDFTVTVTFTNLDKMVPQNFGEGGQSNNIIGVQKPKILLEEIPYGGDMHPVMLDSSTLQGSNGTVVLTGDAKNESIFQLIVENGPALLLINDAKNIAVNIDLSKRENYYTVSGSPASAELKSFIQEYSERSAVVNSVFTEIDSLKQMFAADTLIIAATEKKNAEVAKLNTYMNSLLSKTEHPAMNLFVLGFSSRSFPKADFEKALAQSVTKFPNYETLLNLKKTYEAQQAQLAEQQRKREEANLWVGKQAPDLSLPSLSGDSSISISSFRGKYVLVDFWASWCGPCRNENPNVVKAYNEFKSKNFTILGVSLDKERGAWEQAIKEDQLNWAHMSDLKYWSSLAVETFGFNGIPYNILIDPQGKVIAENLRGPALTAKLAEVLK